MSPIVVTSFRTGSLHKGAMDSWLPVVVEYWPMTSSSLHFSDLCCWTIQLLFGHPKALGVGQYNSYLVIPKHLEP